MDKWQSIEIRNNSNTVIAFMPGYNYPDTSVPIVRRELNGRLDVGNTASIDTRGKWEHIIGEIPGKKISVFFFSWDTINHYGWDSVGWNAVSNGYKVLLRKDMTIEDLKASNYRVTYP